MRDLCRVKAKVPDEPYMAQEIVELPKVVDDSPLKARWATLTPRSKVWADGGDAQLFYRGIISLPLAKDLYTTPSEELVENAAKNLVTVMRLVIDNLSQLNEELRADVQKLKDESGPVALAAAEAQANEAIVKLGEVQCREAETLQKVSYEFGYKIVLTRFRAIHPGLEVEVEVEVEADDPFDDSDPPTV
ncbi:hypothetical protein B296_00009537 [Ensete ventricosum]|uniref:Uncharacterized protein n=1 Tax=Ensete ventricosum TaxID=4639 RepID=A0A427AMG3_ENSVE|nr:hypothetical protein B296_00009537 [Ensete ventricosum]